MTTPSWRSGRSLDLQVLARGVPAALAMLAFPDIMGEAWHLAPHLSLISKALMDLEQRRIRRLIVETPPRHGKSHLISVAFPAWYLGRHPSHRIMMASEESGLSTEFSEKSRDILRKWGPSLFGVGVHKQRTRAADWRLDGHPGRVIAAGVRTGGMTGRGANLLIVDDPIKNPEGALSEVYRQKVWDWYLSTARSRMEPGGIIVITQTRWHQDDLVGRLLKKEAHRWTRIRLPALAEEGDLLGRAPGEPLWPQRMPKSELEAIRDTAEYWWNALYQQAPTPAGGSIAKGIWFKVVGAAPVKITGRKVRYWDIAATEAAGKSDPDWTVGARLSQGQDGLWYIEHLTRVRWSPAEVERLMVETAKADGKHVMIREEQEPGSSGKSIVAARTRLFSGYDYKGVPARSAKITKWMPLLVQAEAGNVRIVEGPWVQPFLDEVNVAPYGTHDDQLDAVSGGFSELAGKLTSAIPGLVW